jgi:hypothetical protein
VNGAPARPELVALCVADPPARWHALGFTVTGHCAPLGGIDLELGAPGNGIVGWRVCGAEPVGEIDGLPTEIDELPRRQDAEPHPNGAIGVDHVVVITPEFDRTAAALAGAGIALRRVREAPGGFRQGFRRLGPAILELVEARGADPGPARFWGLVAIVEDLDALAERLGDRLGPIKAAVQPGRRIATLRESAGLGEAVAFMSVETR